MFNIYYLINYTLFISLFIKIYMSSFKKRRVVGERQRERDKRKIAFTLIMNMVFTFIVNKIELYNWLQKSQ